MDSRPSDRGFSVDVDSLPSAAPGAHTALHQSDASKGKARLQPLPREGDVASRSGDAGLSAISAQGASSLDSALRASPPRAPGTGLTSAATRRSSSPFSSAAAASPNLAARSSPRHVSPATSQIFERDVQENAIDPELAPAIPAHIQTEDHIPPVLEASSLAITENMDLDEVAIVTSSVHQPAAVTVAGSTLSDSQPSAHASHTELSAPAELDESSSNLGSVDPQDPRRLSFISFADVVNAEHAETNKDGTHLSTFGSPPGSVAGNRSPSPVRSPLASERGKPMTPPMETLSVRGAETSPARGGAASITSGHGIPHTELTIETMRQTLQKTGSNDIGGTASQPLSATSADDAQAPKSFR
ncbi:MAG: hypothetical protein M1828_003108 [Chrysothrix sp. TS-e1954]|nr:MAG: hypothetical protein M1828_003108 [Chrysothrix sp. TS-e1954]